MKKLPSEYFCDKDPNLKPYTDKAVIKKIYRNLALEYHPDHPEQHPDITPEVATQIMQGINDLYDKVINETRTINCAIKLDPNTPLPFTQFSRKVAARLEYEFPGLLSDANEEKVTKGQKAIIFSALQQARYEMYSSGKLDRAKENHDDKCQNDWITRTKQIIEDNKAKAVAGPKIEWKDPPPDPDLVEDYDSDDSDEDAFGGGGRKYAERRKTKKRKSKKRKSKKRKSKKRKSKKRK